MADDDETGTVAGFGDPTYPGARRATYTPPSGDVHDDDALADALAAEFARISASGPIPIVPPAPQSPVEVEPAVDDAVNDGDIATDAVEDDAATVEPASEPDSEPVAIPDYPASAPIADDAPVVEDAAPETVDPADASDEPVDAPTEDPVPEPAPAWEPVAWEPPAAEERAWEPPAAGEPAAEEPAWEPPAEQQLAADAPAWEPPAADASVWAPPAADTPAWELPAAESPTSEAEAPLTEAPMAEAPATEALAPETPAEALGPDAPDEPAQPAWMNAPAPDPAQAVDLPEGPPQRPVRRSLPDDQLAGWVDDAAKDGGTLSVIEELQAQLKLREEEAREFHAWEQTMRAMGTPDAISEVEEARPEFTGVLPDASGEAPTAELPETDVPEELYRPPTGWFIPAALDDATIQFSDAAAPSATSAAFDEPTTDEPAPASDEAAPASYEAATGEAASDEPAADEPAPGDDIPPAPATGAFVLPEQPLAAWPAPSWDDPEPAPDSTAAPTDEASTDDVLTDDAPTDDVTTGDVPVDATPVWNLDDVQPEPEAVAAPQPEPEPDLAPIAEPESVPEPEPEGFFLPAPEYEPLHPTSPVETISRGEPVVPSVVDDAPTPAAPPPFAPPALVEPPPIGESSPRDALPVDPPLGDAPVSDVLANDAPVGGTPDASAGELAPNPAPEIVQQDGFPLGEQFFPSADVVAAPSSFDDLLVGSPEEGEPVGIARDPEPRLPAESLFIEPLPASANEPPVTTGSVTIIDQAYQEEIDDDVDETDRVVQMFGPVSVDTSGIAVVAPPISPPSGPISTVRIREDEAVLAAAPRKQPVFTLEASGAEPTPADYRVGKAARLFWLWFASNSSILSIGLGAAVFGLGLSLSQSVVAIFAGIVLSFIPLGLSTLAGKRSGQPTMVVSRATFGLLGNTVPAVLALVTRLFWGAVLLWFLASSVAVVLVGAELNGSMSERQLLLIGLAGGLAIALLIAFFGYALLARLQLVITIVSGVLVLGLIALTWQYVDLEEARTAPYGSGELTVTAAVLVFSFVGLVWAHSAGDLARYQHPESSGAATMLWGTFGVTVPAFVLIAYGALLAASNKGIASGFLLSPLDTLANMLPPWYPIPLLAATILSLLSGVAVSLYSGGFALQAIGVRLPRPYSVPLVAVLLAGLTLVVTFAVPGGNLELFRDGATTLAVPVAAWAGIFAAEMMLRKRRFESQSLLQRGGVYPDVRWLNLIALIVISVIGYGLTTATVTWLSWQGYVFGLLAVPIDSDLAGTDVGVIVALLLGLLVPIVAGIPGIRRQEATEV